MAGVVLLAGRLGRQPQALASLAAAAIVMTLWDPGCAWDVGFQLSFLATLGLVIAGRPAQEALRTWAEVAIHHETGRSAVILVGDLIVITAVAQAATLPLSAYIFHQLPITSLVANAFILPAQPPLMATGALAAFAALADVSLGRMVAWLAWPFAAYSIGAAQWFADLPGASLDLPGFGSGVLVLVYAGLAGVVVAARTPRLRAVVRSAARLGGPLWLVAVAVLATFAWRSALDRPDGRLHLTALPGGDVVLETPGGRFVALSRAPGQVGLARSLDRLLPLTHRRIDWLILAHPQASPSEALEAIGEFAPRGILLVGGATTEGAESEIHPPGGEVTLEVSKGTALDLGGGARLEVRDPRPGRLTILISDGVATLALADYLDPTSLAGLGRRVPAPQAIVLIGEGRNVARALEAGWSGWEPEVIIACPSPGDPFPESLASVGRPTILATPRHGWVELVTDGEHLFVQAERNP
jgi:ComEC/Rec2-related protein